MSNSIKFGTGGIQYASSPGVLTTKYTTDEQSGMFLLTDPFGKIYRFDGNRTYYPNNTLTEKLFSEAGRLGSILHKKIESDNSETTLESLSYQYDGAGNISRITYLSGEYLVYTYDPIDRLTSEERRTASGSRIYKIEYLFDNNDAKNGNIHQVVLNDESVTTFTYNQMNQLTQITHPDTSTETLTYDDNGNLLSITDNSTGKAINYSWDCFNRLTGTTLPVRDGGQEFVGFVWDGDNRLTRIEYPDGAVDMKQYGTDTYTTIETKTPVGMKTPTSRRCHHYNVLHYGQILCRYDHNGESKSPVFYHYDHNSNLSIATDINGRIMEKPMTDAYGNPLPINPNTSIAGSGSSSNPEKNQTKTLQQNLLTGGAGVLYLQRIRMYNMRRRFYNGLMRRFVLVDPINTISSSSEFVYANNNPIGNSDPLGLMTITSETTNTDILPKEYYEKLDDVVQEITNEINQNLESWKKILCNSCPNGKSYAKNIPALSFTLTKLMEVGFDFSYNYKGHVAFGATPVGSRFIYISPAFFALSKPEMKTVLAHEIMHTLLCGWKEENCCNWTASLLGYNSHPDLGQGLLTSIKGIINTFIAHVSNLKGRWLFNVTQLTYLYDYQKFINTTKPTNTKYSVTSAMETDCKKVL